VVLVSACKGLFGVVDAVTARRTFSGSHKMDDGDTEQQTDNPALSSASVPPDLGLARPWRATFEMNTVDTIKTGLLSSPSSSS